MAAGSWIGILEAAPTTRAWQLDGSGVWNTAGNWNGGVPNSRTEIAGLGDQATATAVTVTVNANATINGLAFTGTSTAYTLDVSGTRTLAFRDETDGGTDPLISVSGTQAHTIGGASLTLRVNTDTTSDLSIVNNSSATTGLTIGVPLNITGVDNKTIAFGGTGNTLMSGILQETSTGVLSISKSGSGKLIFTSDNTYDGTTTISAGILESQVASGLGNGGVTLSGGTFSVTTVDQSYANAFSLSFGSTSTISVDPSRTLTLSGVISGFGGLTKSGAGTLVLQGNNSYWGATTISQGIVNIQTATALGNTIGNVSIASGAELQVQGGIAVGAGESITSIAGTGTGSSGALRNISGANTWNGAITLGGATTIGSDAGTLTLAGAVGTAGNLLTVTGGGNTTISGVVSGSGGMTKTGAGALTMTAANPSLGNFTVNQGTVSMSDPTSLGSGVLTIGSGTTVIADFSSATVAPFSAININGGTLSRTVNGALNSTFMTDSANTLTSTGSSMLSDSGGAAAGYLSVNGKVVVSSGTLTLNAAAAGDKVGLEGTQTIEIANGAALATSGSASGNVQLGTGAGRTLIGTGSSASDAKLSMPSGGPTVGATLNASSSIVVNGSGLYGLRIEGKPSNVDAVLTTGAFAALSGSGGTLTVAYDSTQTAYFNTQPTAGTAVKLGFDAAGGSPVYNLSSDGPNMLSNFGGLVVKGGTVGIIDDLKFTGNGGATTFDMSAGTLKLETIGASTKVWFTGPINVTGGTIYGGSGGGATGWLKGEDNMTVASGVSIVNGPKIESAPLSGTKVIGGTGNLLGLSEFSKTGTGDTRLDIPLSGSIQINQGSLLLGADNVIGGGSSVAMNGGTLNTQGRDNSGIGVMSLANNSYLDMAGANIFGTDNSVINFADSSAASWNGGSALYILNWTGIDTVGHGTQNVDQVYFGTSLSGLTPAQVGQIVFVNPYMNTDGSQYIGNLGAIILPTGEVVPYRVPVPETSTVVLTALLGGAGLFRERRRFRTWLARWRDSRAEGQGNS